jgi:hypothetical protein
MLFHPLKDGCAGIHRILSATAKPAPIRQLVPTKLHLRRTVYPHMGFETIVIFADVPL